MNLLYEMTSTEKPVYLPSAKVQHILTIWEGKVTGSALADSSQTKFCSILPL